MKEEDDLVPDGFNGEELIEEPIPQFIAEPEIIGSILDPGPGPEEIVTASRDAERIERARIVLLDAYFALPVQSKTDRLRQGVWKWLKEYQLIGRPLPQSLASSMARSLRCNQATVYSHKRQIDRLCRFYDEIFAELESRLAGESNQVRSVLNCLMNGKEREEILRMPEKDVGRPTQVDKAHALITQTCHTIYEEFLRRERNNTRKVDAISYEVKSIAEDSELP